MATSEALVPSAAPSRRRIAVQDFVHDLVRSGTGLFGLTVVLLIVVSAILAPLLTAHDPTTQSLQDRFPPDLREAPSGPDFEALPFKSLYLLDDEFAAEIANRTMHGVMHIGRVPDGSGGYRAQMAVLVKPNGLLGAAYMAAIRPFRHLVVYPLMLRELERRWRTRA